VSRSTATQSAATTSVRPALGWRTIPARRKLAIIVLLLMVVVAMSLFIGRYPSPGIMSLDRLATDDLAQRLVFNLRLPRILTALALGMSLAAAGAVFQQIFANPLVDPGFLGVSQGAAFGASLAIIFFGSVAWIVQASAALFAVAGLGFSYFLARRARFGGSVIRLVLAGIAVSAFFSAGVGALKYLADPMTQLQEITFWLLGGLQGITWLQFWSIAPAVSISLFVIYRMRWRLNLLSLDDATAFSLGATPGRERALLLGVAVAATAAVVSVCGMVGWVGLIVPHIARRLFGADARYSVPAALLIGGLFGVLCDDVARTLLAGEIPIGILTSLIGALFFIVIFMTYGHVGEQR
jgi:iron complex transport system permease protein